MRSAHALVCPTQPESLAPHGLALRACLGAPSALSGLYALRAQKMSARPRSLSERGNPASRASLPAGWRLPVARLRLSPQLALDARPGTGVPALASLDGRAGLAPPNPGPAPRVPRPPGGGTSVVGSPRRAGVARSGLRAGCACPTGRWAAGGSPELSLDSSPWLA